MGQLIAVLGAVLLAALALTVPGRVSARRARRVAAEAAEYARITGWITKIRPKNAGPAITRDEHGRVDLFRGLRRYAPSGRRTRRGRKV